MLLDNIVRNRAAILSPWQRYARQGNVYFGFHLAFMFVTSLSFLALAAGFLMINWPWINAERVPMGVEVIRLAIYLLVVLVLWLLATPVLYLVRSSRYRSPSNKR